MALCVNCETSANCDARRGEKIKHLLPVHCFGSSYIHYMNVMLIDDV